MAIVLERNSQGQIVKKTTVPDELAQAEPDILAEYRAQAHHLSQALATVQAIHEETASLTRTRDTALSRRQELLNNWVESENEASVEELSKLAARAEVFEAKLKAQADKSTNAESNLKQLLERFGSSCRSLYASLQTFLHDVATDRILTGIHPGERVRARGSVSELAWLDARVVAAAALRCPVLSDYFQAEVLRVAALTLEKTEPLLEAARQNGFTPPPPAQPSLAVAAGVPVAA